MTRDLVLISRVNYLEPLRGYQVIIWPLARVKQFFSTLYDVLLGIIWSELTGESQVTDPLQVSLLFLLFCGLSLSIFYLRDYEVVLFWGFMILWWLDATVNRQRYFYQAAQASVSLEKRGNHCLYTLTPPVSTPDRCWFDPAQVAQVAIAYETVRGGAFETVLGEQWRVYLVLRDHQRWLVAETPTAVMALSQAKQLATWLKPVEVDVVFADSEGMGQHAVVFPTDQIVNRYRRKRIPTIHLKQTPRGTYLRSRWHLSRMGHFLRDLCQRSGFILFILLMTEGMENFGAFLHSSIQAYGDDAAIRGVIIQAIQEFDLTPNWPDWVEVAIALALILWKAAEISAEKRSCITPTQAWFWQRQKRVGQLGTAAIHSILVIHQPYPFLLVLDEERDVILTDWQTDIELYAFWVKLMDTITAMKLQAALDTDR